MKFETLRTITEGLSTGNPEAAISAIEDALVGETGPAWHRELRKLQLTLRDNKPRFSIFSEGNGKLPFLAFSAVPGAGFCPGAGDCLQFCYSFRAWRYPAAFCRQVQNSHLLNTESGRLAILQALDSYGTDSRALRLYVDGDFRSIADVGFWMLTLHARPHLQAYGYSKSWAELLGYARTTGGVWPQNYILNLSSGSRHDSDMQARIKALPIVRGRFIAVPVGHKVKSTDHGTRDHNAKLRAAFGNKAFTCPGKCGECTPRGHACGSKRFAGIDIIIAVH